MESIPTLRMPGRRMLATTRRAVKSREPLNFYLPNMWEIVCGSPQEQELPLVEEIFSETGLPINGVLGNHVALVRYVRG